MVLTISGDQVVAITGFPDPDLFPVFGLPHPAPGQAAASPAGR